MKLLLSSKDTLLSSSKNESESVSITIVQASQPTIIGEYESGFTQTISTALPYRDVIRRGKFADVDVMIDGECLVQLDGRPENKSVRVLFIPLQLY
jgi:hypothetical protein